MLTATVSWENCGKKYEDLKVGQVLVFFWDHERKGYLSVALPTG